MQKVDAFPDIFGFFRRFFFNQVNNYSSILPITKVCVLSFLFGGGDFWMTNPIHRSSIPLPVRASHQRSARAELPIPPLQRHFPPGSRAALAQRWIQAQKKFSAFKEEFPRRVQGDQLQKAGFIQSEIASGSISRFLNVSPTDLLRHLMVIWLGATYGQELGLVSFFEGLALEYPQHSEYTSFNPS